MNSQELVLISGWGTTAGIWKRLGIPVKGVSWIDVLEEKDFLPQEQCILGGWSLGGLLALEAAIKFPDRVRGLVLISSTARLPSDGDYAGADARAIRAMRVRLGKDPQRVMQEFARLCFGGEAGLAETDSYLQEAKMFTPAQLANGLEVLAQLDLRNSIRKITIPTLILHGAKDQVVPVSSARWLAANLPQAQLQIFDEEQHALPLLCPEALTAAIEGWGR